MPVLQTKVFKLGQWEQVALFSSSGFVANNQLARKSSLTVSPVIIPALTTIVDRQFKEDRTLCSILPGLHAGPERLSILTLYFPSERTYLRHPIHYPLYFGKTNHPLMP